MGAYFNDHTHRHSASKKRGRDADSEDSIETALLHAESQRLKPPPNPATTTETQSASSIIGQKPVDNRTEAEKAHDRWLAKREADRIHKMATKSHREKIEELNKYLGSLSEHQSVLLLSLSLSLSFPLTCLYHIFVFYYSDIPKVGPG